MIDYEERAAQSFAGFKPQENTMNQHSTSFRFSLQILAHEGFSVKGDMSMSKTETTIPQRASAKPVQGPADVEEEYDDTLDSTPRSALRFRSTQPQDTWSRSTGPIVAPVTHRVSGSTRFLLWVVLVLCVAFLVNGLVLPAVTSVVNQFRYGDAQLATYDINGRHFLTEENNGHMRIVIARPDGSHTQVLTTLVGGVPNHALVTLTPNGAKIEVLIHGTYAGLIVPDDKGGYQWGNS